MPGPREAANSTRSPKGERTLAALDFEAGRYAEAIAAYERLLREAPKDASLHTSLAGALGASAARRSDGAAGHAVRLAPLNVEAYHNRGAHPRAARRREEASSSTGPPYATDPQLRALAAALGG